MIPALPLAYASQHIYDDRHSYAPAQAFSEPVVTPRRRRRRPSLIWPARRFANGLAPHSAAPGR